MSHFGGTTPSAPERGGGSKDMDAECPFCGESLDGPLPYHLPCEGES